MYNTLLEEPISDALLAGLFACVDNQTAYLSHDVGEGDEWSDYAFWEWQELVDELRERIVGILGKEETARNVTLTGFYADVAPFMERYGYRGVSGWWVRENDSTTSGG